MTVSTTTDPHMQQDPAQAYYSPNDLSVTDDPYPHFRALREQAPVYHNEAEGFWALSRYHDVAQAMKDHAVFSASAGSLVQNEVLEELPFPVIGFMDPPEHSRLRTLVSPSFTSKATQGMQMAARANMWAMLDGLPSASCDLDREVLVPWVIENVAELVEIPDIDRARFRTWMLACFTRERGNLGYTAAGEAALEELTGYLLEEHVPRLLEHRGTPMSDMLRRTVDGGTLSINEATGFILTVTQAGPEDVARTAGFVCAHFATNPGAMEAAREDPSELLAIISETIRREPSTQYMRRTTTRDVEVRGTVIPAGAQVLMLFGSANRDPEAFDNPDAFLPHRRHKERALTFSRGVHSCLGRRVAQSQLVGGLAELIDSVKGLSIDLMSAEMIHAVNMSGFHRLPATLEV